MNQGFWRKSSQWFSLTRSHAELLVRDTQMQAKFEQYCNGYQDGNFCVPDEHYVPTTLALHGLESEVHSRCPHLPPVNGLELSRLTALAK